MWLRLLYYRFITRLFLNGKIVFKKADGQIEEIHMSNSYICGVQPIPMCGKNCISLRRYWKDLVTNEL